MRSDWHDQAHFRQGRMFVQLARAFCDVCGFVGYASTLGESLIAETICRQSDATG